MKEYVCHISAVQRVKKVENWPTSSLGKSILPDPPLLLAGLKMKICELMCYREVYHLRGKHLKFVRSRQIQSSEIFTFSQTWDLVSAVVSSSWWWGQKNVFSRLLSQMRTPHLTSECCSIDIRNVLTNGDCFEK